MEIDFEINLKKCRTCLNSIEEDNAIYLFNDIMMRQENITISNLIMSCASVQISDDDSYPNSICKTCLKEAKSAYLFKLKCEEAQKLLRELQTPAIDLNDLLKVEVHESQDVDDYDLYDLDESQPSSSSFVDVKPEEDTEKSKSNTPLNKRKRFVSYKCSECTMTFTKHTDMTAHRETHTEFKCKHCPHKSSKLGSLRTHIQRKHKNIKNPSYGFEVDSDTDADNSDNDTDSKDPLNSSDRPNSTTNYNCCQCDDSFTNEDDLNSHKNVHTAFKCKVCSASFEFYKTYEAHTKDCTQNNDKTKDTNNSEENDTHECKNCGRLYQTYILLRKHLHTCKSKSSFPCLSCPEVFITYNNLLEHRKIHRSVDCKYCGLKVLRKSLPEHVSSSHIGAQFCIECRQCFESFDLLDKHYKTHTKFCCRECGNIFNDILTFTMHLDTHKFEQLHPENNTCINCGKDYSDRKQLLRHYKSHAEYPCNECDQNFNTPLNLLRHGETHETDDTSLEERTCIVCKKQFKIIENMWKHRATHNTDNSEILYCPYCDFKPRNKIVLGQHMNLDHDSHKTIFCSICSKSFFNPRKLNLHMLTHTGKKLHVCEVCGRGFKEGGNLITHMRIHTGEKPYKCEICGKRFVQSSALKSHMVFHKPGKDHVCPECGLTFARLGGLRLHMKSHSDERPFECSICQKAFKGKCDLKMHEQIHTGIKGFKCNYCGKAFGRKSNLTIHLRIHTGETPHVCTVCGKGFIQLHVLRTHMNTHD